MRTMEVTMEVEVPAGISEGMQFQAVAQGADGLRAGVTLTARDAPHVASIPGAEGAECAFGPPERVALVGSVLLRTCVAPPGSPERPRADVAVALPRTALLEKDYLDYRYHAKRALYLQYLDYDDERRTALPEDSRLGITRDAIRTHLQEGSARSEAAHKQGNGARSSW